MQKKKVILHVLMRKVHKLQIILTINNYKV